MQRIVLTAFLSTILATSSALANPLPLSPSGVPDEAPPSVMEGPLAAIFARRSAPAQPPQRVAAAQVPLGGGFIEFLFGGPNAQKRSAPPPPQMQQPAMPQSAPQYEPVAPLFRYRPPIEPANLAPEPHEPSPSAQREVNPRFLPQEVNYEGKEKSGTIIINTRERYLYLVKDDGKAMRYGIGVGRPGFAWAGVKTVTRKSEWPDWRPPKEMLARQPHLPRYMPGGPDNPLGARALYLGSSLYRIHGSNEPWTIGQAVSSGCIRMRNEDVIDLYSQVKVGTKVVVI